MSSRKLLALFCSLVLLGLGCAKEPPTGKRLPKPKQPEVIKPSEVPPPKMPEPLSPRREASQRIVRLGEGYLERKELDKAVQTFQEAINVDSENGIAYFYMAKALHEKAAYEDALGLLERAQALLSNEPEWLDQVSHLKSLIEQAREAKPENLSTGQEVYY